MNMKKLLYKLVSSREKRLAIRYLLLFSLALSCCAYMAQLYPFVAMVLCLCLVFLPFALLDWFYEPSDKVKEINSRLQEIDRKIQESIDQLRER